MSKLPEFSSPQTSLMWSTFSYSQKYTFHKTLKPCVIIRLCPRDVTFLSTTYLLYSGKDERQTKMDILTKWLRFLFVGYFGFALWKWPYGHLEALTSDTQGQIIYDSLITHQQYSIIGNECISGYSMIILLGKLEHLLWDKTQQLLMKL